MTAKNNELLILDEPTNYMELISDTDFKKWFQGIKSKMNLMYNN
jgi:ATPase subunit of ABC transporter with duplicated ATPase domains